jgi:ABC-type siderophore export system fused ATPase/permease subunit
MTLGLSAAINLRLRQSSSSSIFVIVIVIVIIVIVIVVVLREDVGVENFGARNIVTLCRRRLAFLGQIVFVEVAAFHRIVSSSMRVAQSVPRPLRPETRSLANGLAVA